MLTFRVHTRHALAAHIHHAAVSATASIVHRAREHGSRRFLPILESSRDKRQGAGGHRGVDRCRWVVTRRHPQLFAVLLCDVGVSEGGGAQAAHAETRACVSLQGRGGTMHVPF